jgi:uncharacterized protein
MLTQILQRFALAMIRFYQLGISPILGSHCRHTPSCSHYTASAIQEWGLIKGISLGLKRIARCHPWGTSGYDPVPKKNQEMSENHHSN